MKIVAIDPGETTGWSVWDTETYTKIEGGQTPLWEFIDNLQIALMADEKEKMILEVTRPGALPFVGVERIVCEDWVIYQKEAEAGALNWDKCRTARGIGAIELIARMTGTPIKLLPASIKPAAIAMGAEEQFVAPLHENRHENDSAMLAVFWMVNNRGN